MKNLRYLSNYKCDIFSDTDYSYESDYEGMFEIPSQDGKGFYSIVASNGFSSDWDRISIFYCAVNSNEDRELTYDELEQFKEMFFDEKDGIVQFFPEKDAQRDQKFVTTLWRPKYQSSDIDLLDDINAYTHVVIGNSSGDNYPSKENINEIVESGFAGILDDRSNMKPKCTKNLRILINKPLAVESKKTDEEEQPSLDEKTIIEQFDETSHMVHLYIPNNHQVLLPELYQTKKTKSKKLVLPKKSTQDAIVSIAQ